MDNKQILKIAMEQQAIDCNCSPEDFCGTENKVVISKENQLARKYLKLPLFCNLVFYGNNIVASVDAVFFDKVTEYINKYDIAHCFETPNLHVINHALQEYGMKICFMAEYFLPDMNVIKGNQCKCAYEMKILQSNDFTELYKPEWSNALCEDRKHLDVLAMGAFDGDRLIGLAGSSADCESMWQIGVDVLPDYRKKGIASALTNRLALEILNLEKVPFYCCAWSNIRSVRNAIKSGFKPAWVEMTAKSNEFTDDMNKKENQKST